MSRYVPICARCQDTNDIGHEPGAFTDALGYGPPCPDCRGEYRQRRNHMADGFGNLKSPTHPSPAPQEET